MIHLDIFKLNILADEENLFKVCNKGLIKSTNSLGHVWTCLISEQWLLTQSD